MPTHRQLANAIRILSIDAIQKANSGHPGMPMGMADIAEVLWNDFLKHNPNNPLWPNRDRFVLSNGHGSMLQYSLLHFSGYSITLEDIKNFRQWHSKTPGHPEVGATPGIETTTGPLGQGLANAVGMAIAEKILAATFNREKFNIVDHYTYVFLGDGCLMEGISHEVCSLAGTLGLGKLIAFWDDNGISIDGNVAGWFTDDTRKRFEAYRWHVIPKVNGHNADEIKAAIEEARRITDKPTLICCQTVIGQGSPNKCGKAECHGSPLGEKEIALVKEKLEWNLPPFEIPSEVYAAFDAKERGKQQEAEWQQRFGAYHDLYPELARDFLRRLRKDLPDNWEKLFQSIFGSILLQKEKLATRKAFNKILTLTAPHLPEIIGGSADLTGSNLTLWPEAKPFSKTTPDGNYIYYGVREFGMSAIMNGISLHGSFTPFGGTFLVFYNYATSAVRMAAMMEQRVLFIYSHDSIGLGEDGPTHQPIEQLAALRGTPNLSVWRPCDIIETTVAWKIALERKNGPTALLFSRQDLPAQNHDLQQIEKIKRGGYILLDCEKTPNGIIIATGSEVHLAIEAANILNQQGNQIRVVSIPSMDMFLQQEENYRETVLPKDIKARVIVEAGSRICWHQFVDDANQIIGIDRYGESAPAQKIFAEFGLTANHIVEKMKQTW